MKNELHGLILLQHIRKTNHFYTESLKGKVDLSSATWLTATLRRRQKNTLQDAELLRQFKEVEKRNDDDRLTVKKLIDAFITKGKLKQLVL